MFNPFALHGPAFLAFYIVVGVIALGIEYAWIRGAEAADLRPQMQMTDPYLIAYLRGGAKEALRVVAFSLIDRGLLHAGGSTMVSDLEADRMVRRPIEKAVLRLYQSRGSAAALDSNPQVRDACRRYRDDLEDGGLIAGAEAFRRRLAPFLLAGMSLIFVGVLKLMIALSEGRHNIGFLIVLIIGFCILAALIFRRHRTKRGDAMMADLRVMFGRLRERTDTLRQGGATNEAALLAAVFGMAALSPKSFPSVRTLAPKKRGSGSSCSTGCGSGSSCGSNGGSGSSCGSSCGGGCGGGCGG
jgi:uncharacterized protein (TIGR04222 family)